jgi:N-acetylneuraminate synthase/N,N'-diacetyllegionaminate synthase
MGTDLTIQLGGRSVGDGQPVFFIAEAGVNHNGDTALARELVDAAADAGADAVKFQTFLAENLNTRHAPKTTYHIETTGGDANQTWFDLLKTQEMDLSMHEAVMARCAERGILFLSTPYDLPSVDLLEHVDVCAYKLASTDTTNLPLIRYVARTGKPLILSSAMCSMAEVEAAVAAARDAGLDDVIMLQCTGNYPASASDANVRVIPTYRERLDCLVGYSDHTPTMVSAVAAIALGACVVEKHITMDRELPGPDHRMSLPPAELAAAVRDVRDATACLGSAEKTPVANEAENRLKLRKSVVFARDLIAGTVVAEVDLTAKRPGTGIEPGRQHTFVGRRLARDVVADEFVEENSDMWADA